MITQAEKTNEDIYLSDADNNKGITFIKDIKTYKVFWFPHVKEGRKIKSLTNRSQR